MRNPGCIGCECYDQLNARDDRGLSTYSFMMERWSLIVMSSMNRAIAAPVVTRMGHVA
jgi:hypothetical protein